MAVSIDTTAEATGVLLNDGDSVTTGTFSTTAENTLLLALVAYNGDRLSPEKVAMILHCLVEGNSMRGTPRLCNAEKRTVMTS
jgi:hypothetical protein